MENQTHDTRDPRYRSSARNMRASHADRDAMAEVLREHYAAGRLDAQEFEERIERCLTAKHLGELDDLLIDLPREPAPESPRGPARYGYGPGWGPAFIVPLVVAVIVASALIGGHFFGILFLLFLFFGPFRWWRYGCRGNRPTGT
jgi:hypothetical protein